MTDPHGGADAPAPANADEEAAKAKMRELMLKFDQPVRRPVQPRQLAEVKQQVPELLRRQQGTVSTIVTRAKERPAPTALPSDMQIGNPMGRGSSHKTVYELTNDPHRVFVSVPKSDSKEVGSITVEMETYERLAGKGVGCPEVSGLYEHGDQVGYVATKLTGTETKYMQLGLARNKLLRQWKDAAAADPDLYKQRLTNLRDGMNAIVNSNLVFEDFQCFIGDDGKVSVFDPTGIAEVPAGDNTNFGTSEAKHTADIAEKELRRLPTS